MKFYQGATYNLPFYLTFEKGWIYPSDVKEIEFYFGDIVKSFSKQQITFDEIKQQYFVIITEQDTLNITYKKKHNLQIRVIFADDSIKFSNAQEFIMEKTNYSSIKE